MIEQVTVPTGQFGKWRISRFVVTEKDSKVSAMRSAFNRGRGYVPEGVYTQLFCSGRGVIMSDTPDERRDHEEAVRRAHGHVLINGLGLGMVLGAVLKKATVSRVTVVEIDPDVIALVGHHYSNERLEIVQASAFDYTPPKGEQYGAVWHDIWDSICSDNLVEMTKLRRKYARRAVWQGCWAENWCRHNARRGR
jgi:hypothetical protein